VFAISVPRKAVRRSPLQAGLRSRPPFLNVPTLTRSPDLAWSIGVAVTFVFDSLLHWRLLPGMELWIKLMPLRC
jgi:hypothetical protein